MVHRAKCRLCSSIIQSKHMHDLVICSCGEISVDGGFDYFHASVKSDTSNLLIVDDEGNEIIPTRAKEETIVESSSETTKPSKNELLDMLDAMRKNIEEMPPAALYSPITHADFCALLILLSELFRSDCRLDS